VVLSASC